MHIAYAKQDSVKLHQKALQYMAAENYKKAIPLYNKLIRLNDSNESYYYFRSACYHKIADYPNAIADVQKAMQLHPSTFDYLYQCTYIHYLAKDYKTTLRYCDSSMQIASNDYERFLVYFQYGLTLQKAKDYEGSILNFNKAMEFDYADLELNNDLANSYMGNKQYEMAASLYSKVLAVDTNNRYAMLNMACILHLQNKEQEAIDAFNAFLVKFPNDDEGYANRGISRYIVEGIEAGMQDFEKAISINKNNVLARTNRGIGNWHRKKIKKACKDIEFAYENGKDEPFYDELTKTYNTYCQ